MTATEQKEIGRWVRTWRTKNPKLPASALVRAVSIEFGLSESEARAAINREALGRLAK